jgi:hypothetical protein
VKHSYAPEPAARKAGGADTPLDRCRQHMTTNDPTPAPRENVTDETLERLTIGAVDATGWINPDTLAGDCTITVDATHDARGISEVELRTAVGGGEVSVALAPEAAAQLAAKLRSAAAFAEGDDR